MTIFVLKIIACISMILDHIKYGLPQTENFLTLYFGRLAMPLFAFIASEGYVHTRDINKYIERLLTFGIISQIPFWLFRKLVGEGVWLNVIFTLLLGIIAIYSFDKMKNKYLGFFVSILIIIIGELIHVDYGYYGVGLVFLFYLFRNKKIILTITYTLFVIAYYYFKYSKFFILNIRYAFKIHISNNNVYNISAFI